MAQSNNRRDFLHRMVMGGACAAVAPAIIDPALTLAAAAEGESTTGLKFGLVTYMWGAKWDLPTLLDNCARAKALGVELRTTHAHGVERTLNKGQRSEVRKRFADSPVTLVGIGSNERFDSPDPAVVKKAIKATQDFVLLSRDVGGSGVKVKPDRFHKDVPREKTIEQIGRALSQVARFAAEHGQQIRLEVHGQCGELPTIKAIMDVADHRNATVCWNCNPQDLQGDGLEANLKLVRDRFGATAHIRALDNPIYPTAKFLKLLVASKYNGWALLEEGKVPSDPAAALAQQRPLFDKIVSDR